MRNFLTPRTYSEMCTSAAPNKQHCHSLLLSIQSYWLKILNTKTQCKHDEHIFVEHTDFMCVCLCLTGWVTSASLWQWLCWRGAQPAVGLCVEHFDLVAVDLIVGVEGTKAVCSPSKHKHLCPDDGGWVEVPPACRSALWREDQQMMRWLFYFYTP